MSNDNSNNPSDNSGGGASSTSQPPAQSDSGSQQTPMPDWPEMEIVQKDITGGKGGGFTRD